MSPSPSAIVAKASMNLLFHTAHFPLIFALYYEFADSTTPAVRGPAIYFASKLTEKGVRVTFRAWV